MSFIRHENDLADHTSGGEHLVRKTVPHHGSAITETLTRFPETGTSNGSNTTSIDGAAAEVRNGLYGVDRQGCYCLSGLYSRDTNAKLIDDSYEVPSRG